jgi:hypothetical protein
MKKLLLIILLVSCQPEKKESGECNDSCMIQTYYRIRVDGCNGLSMYQKLDSNIVVKDSFTTIRVLVNTLMYVLDENDSLKANIKRITINEAQTVNIGN